MEFKGTKEVWFYEPTEKVDTGLDKAIVTEKGNSVAWAYIEYDAKLIAAAPELLEALKRMVNAAKSEKDYDVVAAIGAALPKAESVIKKALGE